MPNTKGRRSITNDVQPPRRGPRLAEITKPFTDLARKPLGAIERQISDLADLMVPQLVDALLERIDLAAVTRHIIDQIDLPGLVEEVIQGIDLPSITRQLLIDIDIPQIVRESTNAMTSESVVGLRMLGVGADRRVSRAVDRVLLRKQGRDL